MAIHHEVLREGSEGIIKQIEASALTMIFDNVQKTQYEHPEKSTIRELVSNSVDAINEKVSALQIIKGEIKPEDVYLQRDEPMYADSNYLPEYYDPKWLSNDNKVYIIYEEALPGVNRDTLRIVDNGVGIGHIVNPKTGQSRLQGVLKLGYSTKRNSSVPIGKFGIGAKAALSTGIDSYTMITRHNGCEYHFEIYDYMAQPTVPRFNMETKEENPQFTFVDKATGDIDRGYYLNTEKKNGTEIIIQTKRHHRATFTNAVQSQLLYFKGIDFKIHREGGVIENIPVMAEIKYEDDYIILSRNSQFSKPHFVLNGVNYGYINFQELELEDKVGNIAYKIKPEDVTIKQSRESLVWDDTTRATVLAVQNKVVDIAENLIADELKDTDLIRWIRKCISAIGHSRSNDTIIGELAGMIDKRRLNPKFVPYPTIKYIPDPEVFFLGMEMIVVTVEQAFSKEKQAHYDKIVRKKAKSWEAINLPLYLQSGNTSNKKDSHLCNLHPEGFVKLKVRDIRLSFQESDEMTDEEVKEFNKLKNDEAYYKKWLNDQNVFLKFLRESTETVDYDAVEVPDAVEDPDAEKDAVVKIKEMSSAELRALQGKILCTYPSYNPYQSDRNFMWTKEELVIKDVMLDEAEIVYGFKEDEELLIALAAMFSNGKMKDRYSSNWDQSDIKYEFFNKDFKIVRVAMSAAKHFKDHVYVKDFLFSVDTNQKSVAMHSKLVNWHTGRKINEHLQRMRFLNNFERFNPEISAIYENLLEFHKTFYREVSTTNFGASESMMTDLKTYADKIMDLQIYISKHPDNALAIAAQARSLFEEEADADTYQKAVGINMGVYERLEKVIEYIEPLEHIFNYIEVLCSKGAGIPSELEVEIREILRNKGIK